MIWGGVYVTNIEGFAMVNKLVVATLGFLYKKSGRQQEFFLRKPPINNL